MPNPVTRYPGTSNTAWLFKIKGIAEWLVAYRDSAGDNYLLRCDSAHFMVPGQTVSMPGAAHPQSVLEFRNVAVIRKPTAKPGSSDIFILGKHSGALRIVDTSSGECYL